MKLVKRKREKKRSKIEKKEEKYIYEMVRITAKKRGGVYCIAEKEQKENNENKRPKEEYKCTFRGKKVIETSFTFETEEREREKSDCILDTFSPFC